MADPLTEPLRSVAYYYPEPLWGDPTWVKTTLLFFDGMSLLVPQYMRDRVLEHDTELSLPLYEQGLLTILEPETVIDQGMAEDLATVMADLITGGAFDGLADIPLVEVSFSRMGGVADAGLAEMLHQELMKRGLADQIEDGLSVPVHPLVRGTILVLLCQLMRGRGRQLGFDFQPITDRGHVVQSLTDLLRLPRMRSSGNVVAADLDVVGVDLSEVPLDEVLGYREAHGPQYRLYAESLRQFVTTLPDTPGEQDAAMAARVQLLRDQAEGLRQTARRAWGQKAASLALGCAGAAWTAATGDIVGGGIALAASVGGLATAKDGSDSAFSYVINMKRHLA